MDGKGIMNKIKNNSDLESILTIISLGMEPFLDVTDKLLEYYLIKPIKPADLRSAVKVLRDTGN